MLGAVGAVGAAIEGAVVGVLGGTVGVALGERVGLTVMASTTVRVTASRVRPFEIGISP